MFTHAQPRSAERLRGVRVKLGLLDPARFSHPCELVYEAFLAHREAGSVAYVLLEEDSVSPRKPKTVSGVVETVRSHDGRWQRSQSDAFALPVQADFRLPLDDAVCDLLILRTSGDLAGSSAALATLLGEIGRVLSPGGEVLLLWRRRTEPANGGQPVPGFAGRWLSKIKGVGRALDRRWQGVLRKALSARGFVYSEWLVPEYAVSGVPSKIHVGTAAGIRQSSDTWDHRLRVMALQSVAVRAARQPLRTPWLWAAIDRVRAVVGAPDADLVIDNVLVSPKEKLVLLGVFDGVEIVMRVPLSPAALRGCRQNMRILQRLAREEGFAGLVPGPIIEFEEQGRYVSVESRIQGAPIRCRVQDEQQLEIVEQLLHTLNPSHSRIFENLQGELFDKCVGGPLEACASRILDSGQREWVEQKLRRLFFDARVCVGVTHGDFSVSNIFLDDGRVAGIIDWDDATMRGLPVLDAIGHLLSRQNWRGRSFADSYRRLATRQWPRAYELRFLDRCYDYYAVETEKHVAWVMLHWLHVLNSHSLHWYAQEREFFDEHIGELLDFFLHNLDRRCE